jgi:hypothetical protein
MRNFLFRILFLFSIVSYSYAQDAQQFNQNLLYNKRVTFNDRVTFADSGRFVPGAAAGKILTSDASGYWSWQLPSGAATGANGLKNRNASTIILGGNYDTTTVSYLDTFQHIYLGRLNYPPFGYGLIYIVDGKGKIIAIMSSPDSSGASTNLTIDTANYTIDVYHSPGSDKTSFDLSKDYFNLLYRIDTIDNYLKSQRNFIAMVYDSGRFNVQAGCYNFGTANSELSVYDKQRSVDVASVQVFPNRIVDRIKPIDSDTPYVFIYRDSLNYRVQTGSTNDNNYKALLGVDNNTFSLRFNSSITNSFFADQNNVEINSTTGFFYAPRMTETQRDGVPAPAAGGLLYNTTTNKFNFWNGSAWEVITSSP